MLRVCAACGSERPHHLKKFCSKVCAMQALITRKRKAYSDAALRLCLSCSKNVRHKAGLFCSVHCHQEHLYQQFVQNWLTDKISAFRRGGGLANPAKRYMLEQANYSCEECGWNDRHPVDDRPLVQIDHKDGDPTNCKRENLRVLCPNCHSKTPTHGGRNINNPLRQEARKILGVHRYIKMPG